MIIYRGKTASLKTSTRHHHSAALHRHGLTTHCQRQHPTACPKVPSKRPNPSDSQPGVLFGFNGSVICLLRRLV